MADTEPKVDPEAAPEPPKVEEPKIPKARLDQELTKRKAAEAKSDELAKEIEKLKTEASTPKPEPSVQPEPTVPGQSGEDMNAVMTKLNELEDREARRELAQSLTLTTEQAVEVHGILKASEGLDAQEALMIARGRNTELFGSADQRGYDPGQHASLRPSGGGPPPVETEADRIKAVSEIQDRYVRDQEHSKLLGEKLARASNWAYKRNG